MSTLIYQNCGSSRFEAASEKPSGSYCVFKGNIVPEGGAVTAYQNSTSLYGRNCISERRQCTNGILTGTYNFAACNTNNSTDCTFNGGTVSNGASVTAYLTSTVPSGSTCTQETRNCSNGQLSGSYQYASCNPGQASSCLFNGTQIASGTNVTAYQTSTATGSQGCISQNRNCLNGVLDGNYEYANCQVNAPQSCLFNGQTIADGQTITAYQSSTVPGGQSCMSEVQTCTNGVLSGTFQYASCVPNAPASCLFNGNTLVDGMNITAFQSSTVPSGQTCISQTRTCKNGILSGDYTFLSCQAASTKCLANMATSVSSSGKTTCTYSWDDTTAGQNANVTVTASNNGTGSATLVCGTDGSFTQRNLVCNDPQITSCSGSVVTQLTKTSQSSKTTCTYTWPGSTAVGSSATATVSTSPSGGTGSATALCGSDGNFSNYQESCLDQPVSSCPAGSTPVNSLSGMTTCTVSWPASNVGATVNATVTATNGGSGSASAVCDNSGQLTNISYNCQDKAVTTCSGGATSITSPTGNTTCSYSWPMSGVGTTVNATVTATNGGSGSASAVCGSNGQFTGYNYNCQDKAVTSCSGGATSTTSPSGNTICSYSWPISSVGATVNATVSATNGGTGSASAVCGSNGQFTGFSYVCNDSGATSCAGGSTTINSRTKTGVTCTLNWPQSPVSSATVYGTGTNGGTVSGVCTSSGWANTNSNCP